jgi:glycosyltransferase involved in cell wall biosynthesis
MEEVYSHGLNRINVGIVYPSDYETISPGGIRNYILAMSNHLPESVNLTYYGLDTEHHKREIRGNPFVSMGSLSSKPKFMKTNVFFAWRLRSRRISGNEVLIFHRADNLLAARIARQTLKVLILHGGTDNIKIINKNKGLFSHLYKFIEVIARAKADLVLSVDPNRTLPAVVRGKGVSRAPLVYDRGLFNSVDVSSERKDFAILGRFATEKRHHLVIKAFRDSNVAGTLHAIGDGPEIEKLQEAAGSSKVVFHGFLEPEQIAKLLKDKVGRLITASECEGFPLALLEAGACGCEIVGLDAPGVTNAIEELGGLVLTTQEQLMDSFSHPPISNFYDRAVQLGSSLEDFWSSLLIGLSPNPPSEAFANRSGTSTKK